MSEDLGKVNERLTAALSASNIGIWDWTIETNEIFWDDMMYTLYGANKEDYSGVLEAWEALVHPEDKESAEANLRGCIDGKGKYDALFRVIWPADQSIHYIRSLGTGLKDKNGKVYRLVGTNWDVTDLCLAEKELRKSEDRFRTMFNSSPDAYLIMEPQDNARISDCNFAAEKMLGATRDEIMGMTPDQLSPKYQADGKLSSEKVKEKVKEILQHGRANFEWIHQRLDGEPFWAHVTISDIFVENREVFFVSWRDITEKKQLEEDLRSSNKELEEFAYRTSHDLKSPLLSSINLINLALKSIQENQFDRIETSLNHASKTLAKLRDLVDDILSLTKTKHVEEEETELTIEDEIDQALDKFSYLKNFDRLKIQKDLTLNGTLRVRRSRFVLILENLISNSIKYQDTKEDQSYVKISSRKIGRDIEITIEDNGMGIPKEKEGDVFSMFKRFHNRVAFGSGLGLYMVKKAARILGGDIVYKPQQKGVCFTLKIPHNTGE